MRKERECIEITSAIALPFKECNDRLPFMVSAVESLQAQTTILKMYIKNVYYKNYIE